MIAQSCPAMEAASWQNLLEEHHTLLNRHLDTITLMRQNVENGRSGSKILQTSIQQTESIIQTFKITAHKFMAELHSADQSDHGRTDEESTPPVNAGVSGPTPAEQVLQNNSVRKAVMRPKRKATADHPTPVPEASLTTQRPPKRARTATSSPSRTTTPRTQQSRLTSSPQPPQPSVEEEDDSFLRAVEAKLKEKEEKIWKGMVKKRKRSSESSDAVAEPQTRTVAAASKPRKRTRQTLTQVEGDIIVEHPYTPQPDKQPNKRASPASEYMESILRRGDAKRQKATSSREILVG